MISGFPPQNVNAQTILNLFVTYNTYLVNDMRYDRLKEVSIMKYTAIITFIITAFLISGIYSASLFASEETSKPDQPTEPIETVPNRESKAPSPVEQNRDGRLVYFVDGSRFDEVSELPADEENITWGVVYDDTIEDKKKNGYFSQMVP